MSLFPNPDKAIKDSLSKLAPLIIEKLNFYLGAEFGFRNTESGFSQGGAAFDDKNETFSKSKELRIKTGKLYRSFALNSENTLTDYDVTEKGLKVTYGSELPYAEIHEYGGFVKSKGKMESFFWYKFFNTDNEFYRIMALSVRKKGGVNIPKRPYFNPALKAFRKNGLKEIYLQIIEEITKRING